MTADDAPLAALQDLPQSEVPADTVNRPAAPGDSGSFPIPRHVTSWHPLTRIAFRFAVIYFGLYVLTTQMLPAMLPLPWGRLPHLRNLVSGPVTWIGQVAFGVTARPTLTGSGDTLFDWIQAFSILLVAIAGTGVWSLVHGKRASYAWLHRAFRLFIRFGLGATLVGYGMAKAIPLQMPAPQLTRLLEPFGHFSPMGVLWYSIGASSPYERFTGCVELAAGILLFIPRTAPLGALLALAATGQVFVLNMTYDVPVKLFSFHLMLMSMFLLAPDARRMTATLLAARPQRRWVTMAQLLFGAYIVAIAVHGANRAWNQFGGGAPRPALYGIWTVDTMLIDGVERAPLVTDHARWRRVVVQSGSAIAFWQMNDTPLIYQATYDADRRTIALRRSNAPAGSLVFQRTEPDRLAFDGTVDGHAIRMETTRLDHTQFLLLTRGFNWIQEFPFNR